MTTSLAPGYCRESIADDKLDEIAKQLNSVVRGTALDFAYSVGGLIVRELYSDDVALWERYGTRAPSYRRLAARKDLLLSPSALCRAVGIYTLCERHAGRESWPRLSVSHLQEVLGMHRSQQERLLGLAASERWSVARLRAEIVAQRPKETRGRPRSLLRTVCDIKEFFTEKGKFTPREIAQLEAPIAGELHRTLVLLMKDLDQLEKLVEKLLDDRSIHSGLASHA